MAFIGVRLGKELREKLEMKQYHDDYPSLRWTHPDDLHLTLRFMAEGSESSLDRIVKAMTEYRVEHARFEVKLSHASTFDRDHKGGVLWLGLEEIPDELLSLQKECEALAQSLGYEEETRPYNPHITLGRYRAEDRGLIDQIISRLEDRDRSDWIFELSEISLMKRSKIDCGPIYRDLIRRPFEGK